MHSKQEATLAVKIPQQHIFAVFETPSESEAVSTTPSKDLAMVQEETAE
jgi:hypothetical protein